MTTATAHHEIIELLNHLTPEQQREVRDFAAFLTGRHDYSASIHAPVKEKYIRTEGWAGCLSHLKDQYKSGVELQHETMRWWAEQQERELDDISD